jgi:hypothetical protein
MKQPYAVLSFRCISPDFVQVIETVGDDITCHPDVRRSPDVVTEMEKKYVFSENDANLARKQVMLGRSCAFNVNLRKR